MNSEAKASLLARLASASSSEPQPEESPKDSGEVKAPKSSIKPSMKTNMVAREVRVNVTGIQPGKTADERELFTEEGSSVLVHENGGVIELPAPVALGELLLVANVESKREVVAQVKRTYKAMKRCVELDFAEAAPRFWGMDFSAAAALLPKDAKDAEAAALILAEASPDEPADAPPAPTPNEVEALKREVWLLREKAQAPDKSLPAEEQPAPTKPIAAEPVQLPKPALDFTMSLPKSTGLFRARGKFTPGAKLRLAALTAALVVTLGAAWHWIPGRSAARKGSAAVPAVGANVSTSPAKATREVVREHTGLSNAKAERDASAMSPAKPTLIEAFSPQPLVSKAPTAHASVKRTSVSATPVDKARVRPPASTPPEAVVAAPTDGVVIPPKLIKSVLAVASLENVRDFETGNVVIDAVVGTDGEVHFITVISGPPSLRSPAVEAVKQYRYEPATRNGQPVPEHVHITVRFRFES